MKCNDEGIAFTMEVALKGDSAQQCIDMMKLFDSIVDFEVVPVAKILLQLDLHIKSFEFKSKMFGLIAKIQSADRDNWLSSGLSIMGKVQDEEDAFLIFRALRYMPNSLMGRFAEFTSQYIDTCEPFTDHFSLIHKFLSNNADCIDTVHNNMMYSLHHIGDANEANDLSSELINYNQNFMLDNEHPLYQLAIFVCLITLEANHPKNPYKVFDGHINAPYLNKQELIVPVLKFLDKYVQMKFSAFGDMVRDQITYDTMMSFYNQTPLTSADLHSLLQRVNSRIDQLSPEINSQIKELVKESCGFGLDDLLRNFNDPYLFQLLELTEGSNIAKEKAFFGAILSFILKQSDEVQEGQLVSNQEMALFKMSSSIQNCPAGKNEGILLAYNQLELADKIPTAQQDELSPIASKVKMRCYSLLVEKMDQMISSDTPMMREMTDETGEVAQLSHQSLYVKNRLSSVIGLDHGMRFDLHTNVLYNELIQKSTEQLFHIFASHCTVGFFAEQLIQDF
ncbi:MAG: hypothetical protein FJZ57_08740, partial [Chlamydiae bacterium]|nr:hypothetical protein [Chlamydiota bacterium]